ncbi:MULTISPECIES: hypothetical protein [unclassified Frankia]|uniref:hypothetical protein n=1 Tax=unclassified Frankia TaxID=2632575 RepID=UPI0020241AC9
MLTTLARYWRNNEPMLRVKRPYREAIPHAIFLSWLDRAVNGDGDVFREFAAGGGWADIHMTWRYTAPDGTSAEQHEAFEVKTHRPGYADPVKEAMTQLDGYLNHLSLASGYIVIFDQRPRPESAADGPLTTQTSPAGHTVTIARLTVPPSPGEQPAASSS